MASSSETCCVRNGHRIAKTQETPCQSGTSGAAQRQLGKPYVATGLHLAKSETTLHQYRTSHSKKVPDRNPSTLLRPSGAGTAMRKVSTGSGVGRWRPCGRPVPDLHSAGRSQYRTSHSRSVG
eukprot:320845-Rhodomonas_salina.2